MGEARRSAPRLLLIGAQGQVGWELVRTLSPLGELRAVDRSALDLTNPEAIRAIVRDEAPDVIVNAAAYTHVDRAETESALAHRVNADAPEVLAAEAARRDALLVHFSTDYVFDGTGDRPYREDDAPGPQTAYGASKLAGDQAVLASPAQAYIFRVGWVYGRRGSNFLRTVQRLALQSEELRIVADQRGSPTWSRAIAEAVTIAVGLWLTSRRTEIEAPPRGVYHMASPDHATWHDFAVEIVRRMPASDGWTRPVVRAIGTTEYPTPAPRPAWSVLDSQRLSEAFALGLPPWREQLGLCMSDDARSEC